MDTDVNSKDFGTHVRSKSAKFGQSRERLPYHHRRVLPEGNSGTTSFNFVASLNVASAIAVSFNATTADGTATAPSDYTVLSNAPFTITAGHFSTNVTVQVKGDTTPEPNETFTVTLSSVVGASAQQLAATGTIQNDDAAAIG